MFESVPCPHRTLDDMGSAFAMGCVGGAVWHFAKGWRNSPRGDRIRGAYQTMALRAPTLGGNFAVWGGLFSTYDCAFAGLRKREDPWNAIAAGAATGGTLAARAGLKAMGKNALIGGILLAMIEGLGVAIGKMTGAQQPQQPVLQPPILPPDRTGAPQPLTLQLTDASGGAAVSDWNSSSEQFGVEDFSFNDKYDFDDDTI